MSAQAATQAETPDLPPSYSEAASASPDPANETLEPIILVLAGQTIHAETASTAPLYHLDRGIESLSRATFKVTLERVERAVRTSPENEPSLRDYRRHVYTLEQTWTTPLYTLPSSCPRFFARAVSRRALGHVGLKKAGLLRSAVKALPVDVAGRGNELGVPGFVRDARPLFELRRKDGRWEWAGRDGGAVAVEDDGEGTHRLIVTAPLLRETLDALVALWCCRLWESSAERAEDLPQGMDGGESTLCLIIRE
ncbi:hypothetical protein F4820DRAFT_467160 [Hypoxylon rubiginosum]|uniref:Uncharacterized protein n=1 Tax=Hypoxylon rubiginosum TaxID=110542 RepID=A0ACB9YIX1_9PEZI|nr:hypothetical protein F4820DRAFT_467160 [Hypoxylon rubiginosum]